MQGILEGITYIHDAGIAHRDLKPGNILIDDTENFSTVKLIDFGLGLDQKKADNYCGTITYMAPEVVNARGVYGKSVDIWAMGIIMHMVLTGGLHPLADKNVSKSDVDFKEKLLQLRDNLQGDPILTKLSRSLFCNLCKYHAGQRYTAKESLKHPWITRQLQDAVPLTQLEKLE